MATNFPTSLDNFTNPAGSDPVNNPSHASQHANLNDAIENLEAKVGVTNSAVTTSLDYRVRSLETNPTYTNEMAQDAVAAALAAGTHTNITINYNDTGNSISISAAAGYTNEEAVDAVAVALTAGSGISISYNDPANTITISLDSTIATKTYVDTAITSLGNTAATTYVPQSDVGNIDGVASLDGTGKVPDSQIPTGIARDSEVTSAISTAINNLINSAPGTLDTLGEIATQLAADESAAAALTTVVNGKVSKAGGDVIAPTSTSAVPLTINAPSGSTVNAFDVQQNGSSKLYVNSAGQVVLGNTSLSGGNILIQSGGILASNLNYGATGYGSTFQNTSTVDQVPVRLKGSSVQTKDLLQNQNSAGTTISGIGANGQIYIGANTATAATNFSLTVASFTATTATYNYANTVQPFVQGDTVVITGFAPSGYNGTFVIQSVGGTSGAYTFTVANTTNTTLTTNAGTAKRGAQFSIISPNIYTTPVVIQANASQSSNLTEWQNSSGANIALISAAGNMNINGTFAAQGNILATGLFGSSASNGVTLKLNNLSNNTLNAGGAVLTAQYSTELPLTVKASGGSTGSIQGATANGTTSVVYTSNNSVVFAVGQTVTITGVVSTGNLSATAGSGFNITGVITAASTTSITVTAPSALTDTWTSGGTITTQLTGLVPDLTQWQDSTGLVRTSISSTGNLFVYGNITTQYGTNWQFGNNQTASVNIGLGTGATVSGQTKTIYVGTAGLSGSTTAIRIGSTVSGATSTTNLQGQTIAITNTTTVPGVIIKAMASQTANLQEWQNSTGTILSNIDSTGAMFTITPADSTNTTQVATTAYVKNNIANLISSAPATLDTLNELATALGNDANFSTTVTNSIALKAPLASPTFTGTVSGITKTMVGLGSVDNTTDIAKPISTATQTALDLKAPLASPTFTGTVGGITKDMVGLANVDNTTDALKPVSTATQTALNLKANLASPTLTGTPAAPTATTGTNTTQIATTAFVKTAIDTSVQPGAVYQTSAPSSPAVGQIWIDSDDDVTTFDSNIIRRKAITATAGQTVFTADLPFIDGFEQIFMNGLLLVKTADYATSGGNTVTLTSGAAASDIIEIVSVTGANSISTYTQAETNALLAANTSVAPLSISANTTLVAKKRYFVTSASALTLTLPASPSLNDEIQILDASGNSSTYNITVARNANKINGGNNNLIIDTNGGWYTLLYTGSTYGWKVG